MNKEQEQIIKDILKNNCSHNDDYYYYFKINSNEVLLISNIGISSGEISYHTCSIVEYKDGFCYKGDNTPYYKGQVAFLESLSKALSINYILNKYYYLPNLNVDQVFEFFPQKLKEFYIFNMDLF